MVRRWSYIASDNISGVGVKKSLKQILIKKSFKHTVRFRKNYPKISKILRKKYAHRKVKNSNYAFILNAFMWAKFYIAASSYEKKKHYKYVLPPKLTAKSDTAPAHIVSQSTAKIVNFVPLSLKNKNYLSAVKVIEGCVFFNSVKTRSALTKISWTNSFINNSYSRLLSIRSIMRISVLTHIIKK